VITLKVYVDSSLCELYANLIYRGEEEYTSQDGLIMDIWYQGSLYRITGTEKEDVIYVDSIERR
jgi:hypothetical protein